MIFPQLEEVQEDSSLSSNHKIQKQALQMIIHLYLTRKTDDDLNFLQNNFGTSDDLAFNLETDLIWGLNDRSMEINRNLYGQNSKKQPVNSYSFKQICERQFLSWNFIICFLSFICCLIYSNVFEDYIFLKDCSIFFSTALLITLIRLGFSFYYEESLADFALERDKNNWYRVIRNKKLIQVQEHDLLVGDIIELGFKEKIPASGVLISGQEITLNQIHVQKKYQRKLTIQKSIKALQEMSNLEQKLCFENQTLPSPVIIRGAELIQGETFRMMILTVTQDNLIQKFKSDEGNFRCVQYEKWMRKFLFQWKALTIVMFIIGSFIIILGNLIYNGTLKPDTNLNKLIIFEIIFEVGFLAFLTDITTLEVFLRIRMIKLIKSLQIPEKITQFLTADRILISEQNIVKYDEQEMSKFCFAEKEDIVDESSIGFLDAITIGIAEELLEAIDLQYCLDSFHCDSKKQKVNSIVHVYKPKAKIISCLSETKLKSLDTTKVPERRTIKPTWKNKLFQPQVDRKKKRRSVFLQPLVKHFDNDKNKELSALLESQCGFRRSILEGITQLAMKECRTYYFIKYEEQELDKIHKIIEGGKIVVFTQEKKEKMKKLAKKLVIVYELQPYMLGFNDGFYTLNQMSILVSIGGIYPTQGNFIVSQLKQIQSVGIKALILVKSDMNEEANQHEILSDYHKRDLVTLQPHKIFDISEVRGRSGRLVCSDCLIKSCNCLNKTEELSNVQGFLSLNEYAKIIYNINFEYDLRYLECAYAQICNTSLNFYSSKCNVENMLFSLVESIKFAQVLKRLVRFWLCSLLLNYISCIVLWTLFSDIMYQSQLSLIILLCFLGGFIGTLGNLNISIQGLGKLKRNKMKVVERCSSLLILIEILISIIFCIVMVKFPHIIPQSKDQYDSIIEQYNLNSSCKYSEQNSISSLFDPSKCSYGNEIIYSRLSTVVATYIFVINWFNLVFFYKNIFSIFSNIVNLLILCLYMLAIFYAPSFFNSYKWGLTLIQIFICIVLAFLTYLVSFGIASLLDIFQFTSYFEEELSSQIVFNEDKIDHYTISLKDYMKESNKLRKNN